MSKWKVLGQAVGPLLGVLAISGCVITEAGTARDRAGTIGGRQVEVGYFEATGQGDYVLLTKVGNTWQVKELAGSPPEVPPGDELLFLRARQDGALEVTPYWGKHTWISDAKSMLVCNPEDQHYSACNSAFAKTVPLLAEKRKLDREAIVQALEQSGALQRLANVAQRQQARSNIQARVTKVENGPQLLTISPEEANGLITLNAKNNDEAGKSFRVSPRFDSLVRGVSGATVQCFLLPDAPEYSIEDAQQRSTFDVVARVDYCDVNAPRPGSFEVTEKGAPISVKVQRFEPSGSTVLTLSNSSTNYVSVLSVSVYYFSKIITQDKPIELPPAGEQATIIPTTFPLEEGRFSHVTAGDLAQKTFTFGVAVKYTTTAGGGAKTLLGVRQISLKSALPELR